MNKKELEKTLVTLKKNDLLNLLLELNKKNQTFFDERFASLSKKSMKKIVKGYFNKYLFKHGYVYASELESALEGVEVCINKIMGEQTHIKKLLLLIDLYDVTVQLEGFDDSYGLFLPTLDEIASTMREIIFNDFLLSDDEIIDIIDYSFLTVIKPNPHELYDVRDDIMLSIIRLLRNESLYKRYLRFLNKYIEIETMKDNEHKSVYRFNEERALQIKYVLYSKYSYDDALGFIKENINHQVFMRIHIEYCLKNKKYDSTIKLVDKYYDKVYPGYKAEILEFKLFAARMLKNRNLEKETLFNLINLDKFNYYAELKEFYPNDDFISIRDELLLDDKQRYNLSLREYIIIEDDLQNLMIEDIQAKNSKFYTYHNQLTKDSLLQIKEVYIQLIYYMVDIANTRSKYRKVCYLIERFTKDYDEYPYDTITGIKVKYPRRVALLDEIEKLHTRMLKKYPMLMKRYNNKKLF